MFIGGVKPWSSLDFSSSLPSFEKEPKLNLGCDGPEKRSHLTQIRGTRIMIAISISNTAWCPLREISSKGREKDRRGTNFSRSFWFKMNFYCGVYESDSSRPRGVFKDQGYLSLLRSSLAAHSSRDYLQDCCELNNKRNTCDDFE
jgi:hypothetical protein